MGKSIGVNHVYSEKTAQINQSIFTICLLSSNHRKRIQLVETDSAEKAYEIAMSLAARMEKKLVPFNPTISKATLAKRYERH